MYRSEDGAVSFKNLLDHLMEGCQVIDPTWRYLYVNDTTVRHAGVAREALIGHRMMDVYPGIEATPLFAKLAECMERRVHGRMTNEFVYPDGSVAWFELSIQPVPEGLLVMSLDTTEHRRAFEALRRNDAMLRAFSDAIPDPIFLKDRESRWIFANPAALRVVGKSLLGALGRTDREIYADTEAGAALMETDRRIMDAGVTEVLEEFVPSVDGEKTYLTTKAPYRDAEGRVIGIIGSARDITDRKAAEARIARLSRMYQTVSGINESILRSADETELFANVCDTVLSLEGYRVVWIGLRDATDNTLAVVASAGALADQTRTLRLPLDPDAPGGKVMASEAFRRGVTVVSTALMTDPYGAQWRAQVKASGVASAVALPLRRGAEVVGVLGIASSGENGFDAESVQLLEAMALDVSFALDNLARARALRESEERFRAIFELAAVGVAQLDPRTGRFERVNQKLCDILGYTRDEMLARTWRDITHPDDVVVGVEAVAKLARMPSSHLAVEKRYVHRDGSVVWANVTASRRLIEGRREALQVAIIEDITARKRAEASLRATEEQLRAAQKMEAIGRLAGGVAHDFNNLLCVIGSYTDFALEAVGPHDPVASDLQEIRKASERAESLTRQLLAFSRKQILQPEVLDLNTLVASTEKMLRRLIGEDIAMTFAPSAGLWPVRVDPGQIEQVLMNLAVNARDAMPEGGALTLATANVEGDGARVALTVTDTGCGMDEATRARIFEPFFTTKGQGKGTGLGLAMVYGIVQQSGGSVTVDTAPGRGTVFTILLPAERAARVTESIRVRGVERAVGSETVLVVEDEEAVRNLAHRILTAAGYEVLVASTGDEAEAHCAHAGCRVSLLLTDVVMPGVNGRALAERLVAIRPSMKVLYMSGYTDDVIAHRGVLDEGTNFIPKPFNAEALTRKVRAVLDQP